MKVVIYSILFFAWVVIPSSIFAQEIKLADSSDVSIPEPAPEQSTTKHQIFTLADVMPEFPGGQAALYKFLQQNLIYPQTAVEEEISGKVYVKFVVDEDGSITDATVTRGVRSDLNNEALRVVRKMPKWQPGSQKGGPVKVYYSLPINFVLQ